jgi:hypothetical protein
MSIIQATSVAHGMMCVDDMHAAVAAGSNHAAKHAGDITEISSIHRLLIQHSKHSKQKKLRQVG